MIRFSVSRRGQKLADALLGDSLAVVLFSLDIVLPHGTIPAIGYSLVVLLVANSLARARCRHWPHFVQY